MKIKTVYNSGAHIFFDNLALLLPFGLVASIMITIVYVVSYLLIGESSIPALLASLLIFPLLLSIDSISKKLVENEEVEPKDFYFGFRNFGPSLLISVRCYFSTMLFYILGSMAGMFIISLAFTPYILINYGDVITEFMNTQNVELLNNITFPDIYLYLVNILSVIGGLLFSYLFGIKKRFVSYLTLDNYELFTAEKYSIGFYNQNKKKMIIFSILFIVVSIAIYNVYYWLFYLFIRLEINEALGYGISILISFILLSLLLEFKCICNYSIYKVYGSPLFKAAYEKEHSKTV